MPANLGGEQGAEVLRRDTKARVRPAAVRWMVGLGAALLLGLTVLQGLDAGRDAWAYTTALVLAGVVAVLAGIGLRERVLVLAGAGAVGLGVLRALFLVLQDVPLFVVFGVVAGLLLATAVVLTLLRERVATARTTLAGWGDWE